MRKSSPAVDVALVGTGVAPLVAANRLINLGKKVAVLNPDRDFFQENSELALDPIGVFKSQSGAEGARLQQSFPEWSIGQLRPEFPGAIEYLSLEDEQKELGFRDRLAPHVRSRSRIWMKPFPRVGEHQFESYWEKLEELYLMASERGMGPRVLDGIMAGNRFPGFAGRETDGLRAIQIPKLVDVDVDRYRNGLLEYIRERLGEQVFYSVSQLELTKEGVRFFVDERFENLSLTDGVVVFWTPRLTQWLIKKIEGQNIRTPKSARVWEDWTLASRDPLDAGTVGVFEDLTVCSKVVGGDSEALPQLSVLRAGPSFDWKDSQVTEWATSESFESISRLCHEFLKWNYFSVLSMSPCVLFEWEDHEPAVSVIPHENHRSVVVSACDGPLFHVVANARGAVDRYSEVEE